MLRLTSRTVTQFRIQRLLPLELILYPPTMAVCLVLDVETLIGLVGPVRSPFLPFIYSFYRFVSRLLIVHDRN